MSTFRKAVTIFDEDTAITLLRPFSGEHSNELFIIAEDAYGEMVGYLSPISDIKKNFDGTSEEFEEILKQL